MDGPWKIERGGHGQVIKPHVLAPALIDLECDQAGAIPVGGVGHRFARAAVVAAAVLDVPALDLPVFASHFSPPCLVYRPPFADMLARGVWFRTRRV
jgi:hypothetical protein